MLDVRLYAHLGYKSCTFAAGWLTNPEWKTTGHERGAPVRESRVAFLKLVSSLKGVSFLPLRAATLAVV